MKKIIFLIVFLFINNTIRSQAQAKHGQAKIDSLLTFLKTANDDTVKVNTLNKLCREYMNTGGYTSGIDYGKRGISLSQKLNFKQGEAKCYTSIGFNYSFQSDFQSASECFNKSLKIDKEMNDKNGIATNYAGLAWVCDSKSDYNKSLEYYFKGLKIFETLGNTNGIGSSYNNIGLIYDKLADYPKALDCYFKSLKMAEEHGEKTGISNCYRNIGIIYYHQKDFSKALDYYNKALKIYNELGSKREITNMYVSMGVIYKYQSDYRKAFEYYNKGVKGYLEMGDQNGLSADYINIGAMYIHLFEVDSAHLGFAVSDNQKISHSALLDSAMVLNKKALAINVKLKDKFNQLYCLSGAGDVYYHLEKYKEAIAVYQQTYFLAGSLGALESMNEATKGISDCYKKLKDYEKAFSWYEKYIKGKDSVFNQEKSKEITRKELKFEYDKKIVADSVKSESEKKVISAELKQEQIKSYALYGGVALLLVFGGFMFNRFRVTQKQKNIIGIQKNIVEQKNKEITDSIEYALRIQTAILPPQKIVKQYLENSFVLYKPKDIVAGDFYWMETVNDLVLFAACDCTGHGVPGAMVSVVCHNALNRAVREFGLTQPAAILDKTAEIVIENFSKSEEDIKDGMDISLCSYNAKTKIIQWAGANNPLWLLQNGELIETKADKQPIGMNENSKPFTNHTFNINATDTIYLFTDGFADQFGGDTGQKKLTKKRFKDLILFIQNKSLQEQGIALDKFITEYRKEVEQIDDILVMGVKV